MASPRPPAARSRATQKHVNGIDVERLRATIDAVENNVAVAGCRFRVSNRWVNGGHNQATVGGFYGACEEHRHQQTFRFDMDEPPLMLGHDQGANPVEVLLVALSGCVTSAIVYHAAARGIEIDEIESSIEGDIDMRGFLGLDDSVPNGFQCIRMHFCIRADVDAETLEAIVRAGHARSPVFDTITRAVPIEVSCEPMDVIGH